MTPQETIQKLIDDHLFTTDRRLHDYQQLLGSTFASHLDRLGPGGHWIDMGAGDAYALADYAKEKSIDRRAKLTAVGLKSSAIAEVDGARYFYGKKFQEISKTDLGAADIITDVVGVLTYTDSIDQTLNAYLSSLKTNGIIYVFHPTVFTWVETTTSAHPIPLVDWLNGQDGIEVTVQLDISPEQYNRSAFCIRKTRDDTTIDTLELKSAVHEHGLIRIFSETS